MLVAVGWILVPADDTVWFHLHPLRDAAQQSDFDQQASPDRQLREYWPLTESVEQLPHSVVLLRVASAELLSDVGASPHVALVFVLVPFSLC